MSNPFHPPTVCWAGNLPGTLLILDQTLLPSRCEQIPLKTIEDVWDAIKRLAVRGAPAIGVTAAYGVVLDLQDHIEAATSNFLTRLEEVTTYLKTSRPTAVNLFWALDRMSAVGQTHQNLDASGICENLLKEAQRIHEEDQQMCAAIGKQGAKLIQNGFGILTHCNAGALATGGDGTALSVIFAAAAQHDNLKVFADETRPLLQGARLTTWELMQRNIPVTLLCDSMAGWCMHQGMIQAVVTGADRIARNGDTANKIGTYSLAVMAKHHNIPFYIAAPSSTFDFSLDSGCQIPIEERSPEEVTEGFGVRTAPNHVSVANPAFDVTPARLITAMITEKGIIKPVDEDSIHTLLCYA